MHAPACLQQVQTPPKHLGNAQPSLQHVSPRHSLEQAVAPLLDIDVHAVLQRLERRVQGIVARHAKRRRNLTNALAACLPLQPGQHRTCGRALPQAEGQ